MRKFGEEGAGCLQYSWEELKLKNSFIRGERKLGFADWMELVENYPAIARDLGKIRM